MTALLIIYALIVALFPKRILDHDGAPYLTRYFLFRSPWLNIFLHRIHRADKDRHMHNHPWPWSWSFILRGGYMEQRLEKNGREKWLPYLPGYKNTLTTAAYHRITYVKPGTLTLFVAGRYVTRWGFLVDGKHVDSEEYLR